MESAILARLFSQHVCPILIFRQALLTSSGSESRTAANAIYCPPILQASSLALSAVRDTPSRRPGLQYSYFFEAFENLSAHGDENSLGAHRAGLRPCDTGSATASISPMPQPFVGVMLILPTGKVSGLEYAALIDAQRKPNRRGRKKAV